MYVLGVCVLVLVVVVRGGSGSAMLLHVCFSCLLGP